METEDGFDALHIPHLVVVLNDGLGHVLDGGELGVLLEVVIGDVLVSDEFSAAADHRSEGLLIYLSPGAVVLDEIPENSTAVGVPARVIKRNGKRVDNLDQVHIPDPVSQEFCRLNAKIEKLEKELAKYKEKEEKGE